MHTFHPTLTGSAPGHKLQKPSKESGIFQSLGTISFVLFYLKAESKGGGMALYPLKYAPEQGDLASSIYQVSWILQHGEINQASLHNKSFQSNRCPNPPLSGWVGEVAFM